MAHSFSMQNLPLDVIFAIQEELDVVSLAKLSATNRYFRYNLEGLLCKRVITFCQEKNDPTRNPFLLAVAKDNYHTVKLLMAYGLSAKMKIGNPKGIRCNDSFCPERFVRHYSCVHGDPTLLFFTIRGYGTLDYASKPPKEILRLFLEQDQLPPTTPEIIKFSIERRCLPALQRFLKDVPDINKFCPCLINDAIMLDHAIIRMRSTGNSGKVETEANDSFLAIIRTLLEHGAKPNAPEPIGFAITRTPLYRVLMKDYSSTSRYHQHDLVKMLLEYGALEYGVLEYGYVADAAEKSYRLRDTPLHMAARKGLNSILKLLLEYGMQDNERNNLHQTALLLAVQSNNLEAAAMLLDKGGMEFNCEESPQHCTPLHEIRSYEMAEMLLQHKNADRMVNIAVTGSGYTPLHCVINDRYHVQDRNQVIITLLEHGASPNKRNTLGLTAFHEALKLRVASDVVKEMLTRFEAMPDVVTPKGNTSLHFAIIPAIAKYHVPDTYRTISDMEFFVPFSQEYCQTNVLENLEQLLQRGVKMRKNRNGFTPLELLLKASRECQERQPIVDFLKKFEQE
ncbi:ankyrin repeat-containing domain protein [Pyronema omphalodes]|nr:ankyrin repeat-containing domain protein [Pyronema omphalodes]